MAQKPYDVNRPISIISAIIIGVIGPSVFIVQPGFVQGLVAYLQFSDQDAGYVMMAEMSGIALSTIALIYYTTRVDWHKLLYIGALIMVVGNLFSIVVHDFTALMGLRFVVGMASGILISLSFTTVGLTRKVDFNFGLYIAAVLAYGAIGLLVMPNIFDIGGITALYIFFAAVAAIAFPFIRHLPHRGQNVTEHAPDAIDLPTPFRTLALLAMLAYFLAQGIVWAYLFLIGIAGNLSEYNVAYALMLCQFFGIAGALTTTFLGNRWGRAIPLSLGIIAGLLSLTILRGEMTFFIFALGVCIFNYTWNVVHPYLLAAMASFDKQGRMVVYAIAAQMVGLAGGPGIAAYVIEEGNYWPVNLWGMVFFAASLIFILPPVLRQKKMALEQRGRLTPSE